MADQEKLSVGGYLFLTRKDAQLAEAELKKIEYLEARIDYSRPESILLVYEKSIHERLFRTPPGIDYLKKQRDFLLGQPGIPAEKVPDIELYTTFSGELRESGRQVKKRIRSTEERDRIKYFFRISLILNVLLLLAVMAMFNIALKSDNPNVLNYERTITNKYAEWEQNLTERERAVREKEKELRDTWTD